MHITIGIHKQVSLRARMHRYHHGHACHHRHITMGMHACDMIISGYSMYTLTDLYTFNCLLKPTHTPTLSPPLTVYLHSLQMLTSPLWAGEQRDRAWDHTESTWKVEHK